MVPANRVSGATDPMKVCSWNIRGSGTNWDFKKNLLVLKRPHIMILNETWRPKDITGYTAHHIYDQNTGSNGGVPKINVSMYVSHSIISKRLLANINNDNILVIGIGQPMSTFFIGVYMRCSNNDQNQRVWTLIQEAKNMIEELCQNAHIIIAGDFNQANPARKLPDMTKTPYRA